VAAITGRAVGRAGDGSDDSGRQHHLANALTLEARFGDVQIATIDPDAPRRPKHRLGCRTVVADRSVRAFRSESGDSGDDSGFPVDLPHAPVAGIGNVKVAVLSKEERARSLERGLPGRTVVPALTGSGDSGNGFNGAGRQ